MTEEKRGHLARLALSLTRSGNQGHCRKARVPGGRRGGGATYSNKKGFEPTSSVGLLIPILEKMGYRKKGWNRERTTPLMQGAYLRRVHRS